MQEKTITVRLDEKTHKKLKVLAAQEGMTIKECFLIGLDKAFPGWRDLEIKK